MTARFTQIVAALMVSAWASTASAQTRFFAEDKRWALTNTSTVGTNSDAQRQLFLNNLVGVGTESFESYADNTSTPLALSFSGAGNATLSNNGQVSNNAGGAGRRPTDGVNYWDLSTGGGGAQFSISFSNYIAAFGVYGVDVGDFGDQLTLAFYSNGSLVEAWSPLHGLGGGGNGPNDGNLNFFGYINTQNLFNEIRFSSTSLTSQDPDFWGFDQMTIGSVEQVRVPEPGVFSLIGFGAAALLWRRRRAV